MFWGPAIHLRDLEEATGLAHQSSGHCNHLGREMLMKDLLSLYLSPLSPCNSFDRENSSTCWFTHQITTMARTKPGEKQEPGTPPGPPLSGWGLRN